MLRPGAQRRYVPTAPAFFDRCRRIHQVRSEREQWLACLIGEHGPGQQPWYVSHEGSAVTPQAVGVALKSLSFLIGMRGEAVKYRAQHRINRRHLNQSSRAPTYINLIRKVNGSRVSRINPVLLKTRFG